MLAFLALAAIGILPQLGTAINNIFSKANSTLVLSSTTGS